MKITYHFSNCNGKNFKKIKCVVDLIVTGMEESRTLINDQTDKVFGRTLLHIRLLQSREYSTIELRSVKFYGWGPLICHYRSITRCGCFFLQIFRRSLSFPRATFYQPPTYTILARCNRLSEMGFELQ